MSALESRDDPCPLWLRTERVLWEEDDARPHDRERIEGAWLRLFGTPLADEREVDSFDGGDTTWTLYASGRIAISSYCGEAISVARVIEVLACSGISEGVEP